MGETIEVPLNPPGQTRFVYDKDNRVSTHGKIFYRNIRSKAAQARVAAEQKAAADHLEAHPPVHACPECEFERVSGHIVSQHKHTCCQQEVPQEEPQQEPQQEQAEDVFYDLPDSTRDSWRSSSSSSSAAAAAAAAAALSMPMDSEGLSPRLQASQTLSEALDFTVQ
jgi:hypothetical protein